MRGAADLFIDREEAIARADFIADYATSTSGVGYVGARSPVLGIFAVDVGGKPRAMIGPIARAYELWRDGPRLDDEASTHLAAADRAAPWAARYTAPAPPKPEFDVMFHVRDDGHSYLTVTSPRPLGTFTVETLDHHRLPVQRVTRRIGSRGMRIRFDPKLDGTRATLRVTVGRWSGYAELHCMDGCYLGPVE